MFVYFYLWIQRNGFSRGILSELAKKIDTSRSNIANYENNKNMPSIDVLSKLSKVLDCSIDYLLGKSDERNPKETDPLGLAKIGFNMKDYNPPSETQKQQIKGLLEVIMKDNKKDVGDKKDESK